MIVFSKSITFDNCVTIGSSITQWGLVRIKLNCTLSTKSSFVPKSGILILLEVTVNL
jgi:hypothetical protein